LIFIALSPWENRQAAPDFFFFFSPDDFVEVVELESDFVLEDEDEPSEDEPELESLEAPGLGPEYRSAYHPPPLRVKVVWLISFSTFFALHFGQVRTGGSDIFCHSSKRCPHAPQAYS
jgi:hypothetical protein